MRGWGWCRFARVKLNVIVMEEKQNLKEAFVGEIKGIIDGARANAVRSVNFSRVQMYWNIGRKIFEEEQHGKKRADYGSGFSKRQLEKSRQFYKLFPIASALRTQLNWTQYKLLIAISDASKREYYELEAVNNAWTSRELERQINSMLYERLLLSNDKESVLAVARRERIPESPQEVIKDPKSLIGKFRKRIWSEQCIR